MNLTNIALFGGQIVEIQKVIDADHFEDAVQDVAFAATVNPVPSGWNTCIVVGALTGALTIGAPTGSFVRDGAKMSFLFTQDGTGGRAVTWNAVFIKAADSGSGASTNAATEFIYNAAQAKWIQLGGAMTFR